MTEQLRYRAVLFDLDGTLVDSYAALAEAVNYARRQHGLDDLTMDAIREFVGYGLEKLLQRAFDCDVVPASATEAFEARYDEICCTESRVLADVEAAHNSGIAAAVVPTGSSSPSALKAAGPDHYLDRLADLVQIVRNGAGA